VSKNKRGHGQTSVYHAAEVPAPFGSGLDLTV
jgi:hypothetical protein